MLIGGSYQSAMHPDAGSIQVAVLGRGWSNGAAFVWELDGGFIDEFDGSTVAVVACWDGEILLIFHPAGKARLFVDPHGTNILLSYH